MKQPDTKNNLLVKSKIFQDGMLKDVSDLFISEKVWTHAVNAINRAHYGEYGVISNEPSNKEVSQINYIPIGFAYKAPGELVIFSTRQERHGQFPNYNNSDIGIFNEYTLEYRSIFPTGTNRACLDFALVSPITAVCKKNHDNTWSVYWQDGYNEDRVINLDNPPLITTLNNNDPCADPIVSPVLDCQKIKLNRNIDFVKIGIKKHSGGGQLVNGSYFAVIAFSEKGIRLTDYSMPSSVISLWSHEGGGHGLDITVNIEGLSSEFNLEFTEFQLVVVGFINGQTVAKKVGDYPVTNKTEIHVDLINESLPTVDIEQIPMRNVIYQKSRKMFTVNNYLIRTGVIARKTLNYQPKANKIQTEWVAVSVPKDYYFKGGTAVGYMRGEVYSFFLRWIYKDGSRSYSYHIPGRDALSGELDLASGNSESLDSSERVFEVKDTSILTQYSNIPISDETHFKASEKPIEIGSGKMQYWESSEKYPVNSDVWADLCNTPIRHHKMPSEKTVPLSYTANGKEYIVILGVRFKHIEVPNDPDIIGYEILRGSREGNKSVIAKGIFNHMMTYKDYYNDNRQWLIQNYPYNQITGDPFLATNYGYLHNKVIKPTPFTENNFRKDIFSFHSPETNFNRPYLTGVYAEITQKLEGTVYGKFEYPYKHPKHKLITNFAFVTSMAMAAGIAIAASMGKVTNVSGSTKEGSLGLPGVASTTVQLHSYSARTESISLADYINNLTMNASSPMIAVSTMASYVLLFTQFAFYLRLGLNEVLTLVRNASKYQQYFVQYNSHCAYDRNIVLGKIRRFNVNTAVYVGSHIQNFVEHYSINNLYRNKYVCVQFNKECDINIEDDSKVRMTKRDLNTEYVSKSQTLYGALRVKYRNQYGQIDSIVQVPTGYAERVNPGTTINSKIIFGGDTYINRYTEKNPYMFFNDWLYDAPDGTEFDYRGYVNGPNPVYWFDASLYDADSFQINLSSLSSLYQLVIGTAGSSFSEDFPPVVQLPHHMHNLDNLAGGFNGILVKKNAYAYLSHNGVRDFYVESEMNLSYRDYGHNEWEGFYNPHYGSHSTPIEIIFRTDLIRKPIYYKYDNSLSVSKSFLNFATWGKVLPRDYNDEVYERAYFDYPRRVIYSLQHKEGYKQDLWRIFLPLNYKDFKGIVSSIHSFNVTGAILLFEDAEPILFQGIDTIQTTGDIKYFIGDSGLFANTEQTMVNADDVFGEGFCISSRGVVNTSFGLFFISQPSGKVYQVTGSQLTDITRGLSKWFKKYLPSQLLSDFPDYPHYDNPLIGVACQMVYDPTEELIYVIKRDFKYIRNEGLNYDSNTPYVTIKQDRLITSTIENEDFFEDCSFVASYDPTTKKWISFHTWKPSLVMPSIKHFYTFERIRTNEGLSYMLDSNSKVWLHNDRTDSYCVYYNQPSYWEVEFAISVPITVLRNLEYVLECHYTSDDVINNAHLLDYNFNRALIYNTEQISGWLKLNVKSKTNPFADLQYPRLSDTMDAYEILSSKEENKYRISQFWDIVRDRGEFSSNVPKLFNETANGILRDINLTEVDYQKSIVERKKFRHYTHKILLKRVFEAGETVMPKMILKIVNVKLGISVR